MAWGDLRGVGSAKTDASGTLFDDGTYSGVIVTLDGLAWDAASDWEKANTVIHELGHVFNLLNGLPGSKIVPDMGSANGA